MVHGDACTAEMQACRSSPRLCVAGTALRPTSHFHCCSIAYSYAFYLASPSDMFFKQVRVNTITKSFPGKCYHVNSIRLDTGSMAVSTV